MIGKDVPEFKYFFKIKNAMRNLTVGEASRKSKKQNEAGSWYLTQSTYHKTERSNRGTAKPYGHPSDV